LLGLVVEITKKSRKMTHSKREGWRQREAEMLETHGEKIKSIHLQNAHLPHVLWGTLDDSLGFSMTRRAT
jgi:hypothetical protein